MNRLRLLNFDDLFLMRLLADGGTITGTARQLGLTQPAVTQRVRKIERVFGRALVQRSGRRVRLTAEGRALCARATAALTLMGDEGAVPETQVINVGTRPEVGLSWLWPALVRLRRSHPGLVYHLHFGSGEEILRMLGQAQLDAVVTSAPHTVRGYGAISLAVERYVFVATPAIARRIGSLPDVQAHLLVEHDRSFPFLRYLDAATRAQLRPRDVWFVGSTSAMREAVLEGLGVAILPEYLVREALARRRLARILPRQVAIESDHFRLVFRADRGVDASLELLAATLRGLGLR